MQHYKKDFFFFLSLPQNKGIVCISLSFLSAPSSLFQECFISKLTTTSHNKQHQKMETDRKTTDAYYINNMTSHHPEPFHHIQRNIYSEYRTSTAAATQKPSSSSLILFPSFLVEEEEDNQQKEDNSITTTTPHPLKRSLYAAKLSYTVLYFGNAAILRFLAVRLSFCLSVCLVIIYLLIYNTGLLSTRGLF